MVDLPLPSPSGFQPRIGVRGVLLIAGMTMALRRPHKRMKIAGVSGILGWEEAPVLWGSPSPQSSPRGEEVASLPPFWIPVPYRGTGQAFDCRNDEWGAGLTKGCRE